MYESERRGGAHCHGPAPGPLERIADHTVLRDEFRLENTWTRGWQRTATVSGRVGDTSLGTLLAAELSRVDQGEVVVQHPLP